MVCLKCGIDNPPTSVTCRSCQAELDNTPPRWNRDKPGTPNVATVAVPIVTPSDFGETLRSFGESDEFPYVNHAGNDSYYPEYDSKDSLHDMRVDHLEATDCFETHQSGERLQ